MAGRHYTEPQKLEAVALARTVGADIAADQLGIDVKTVRRWLAKAGDAPELGADPGTWRALMDLAIARAASAVAGGKLTAVQVATIAGIAARNAQRDPKPEPVREPTEAEVFVDTLEAYAAGRGWEADRALMLMVRQLDLDETADLVAVMDAQHDLDAWSADIDAANDRRLAEIEVLRDAAAARHATSLLPPDLDELLAEVDAFLETHA